MKRGLAHWHVFAVFAVVSFGLLFLTMKMSATGRSDFMLSKYDDSFSKEIADRDYQKSQWLKENSIVGEMPAFTKIVAGSIFLLGLFIVFVVFTIKRGKSSHR